MGWRHRPSGGLDPTAGGAPEQPVLTIHAPFAPAAPPEPSARPATAPAAAPVAAPATGPAVPAARTAGGAESVWPKICEQFALRVLAAAYQMSTQLEAAEAEEQNPDRLETLYRIDHAHTLIRRQAENLQVLAGRQVEDAGRRVTGLLDAVRAASSAIEHYPRIRVGWIADLALVEYAADDVIRVLTELLDNAARFSPPASNVLVSAQITEAGSLLMRVEDNGIGLPPDRLTALNAMFEAPRPAELDGGPDAHLGLLVVQRLALAHRLQVRLTSCRPGGTTVTVLVPAELICSPSTGDGPPPGGAYRGRAPVSEAQPVQPYQPYQPPTVPEEGWRRPDSGQGLALTPSGLPRRPRTNPRGERDGVPAAGGGPATSRASATTNAATTNGAALANGAPATDGAPITNGAPMDNGISLSTSTAVNGGRAAGGAPMTAGPATNGTPAAGTQASGRQAAAGTAAAGTPARGAPAGNPPGGNVGFGALWPDETADFEAGMLEARNRLGGDPIGGPGGASGASGGGPGGASGGDRAGGRSDDDRSGRPDRDAIAATGDNVHSGLGANQASGAGPNQASGASASQADDAGANQTSGAGANQAGDAGARQGGCAGASRGDGHIGRGQGDQGLQGAGAGR